MTEAELAEMVARAIIAHDDNTTWFEELTHNIEVMATMFLAGLAGIAFVVRLFHHLDKRVQAMEQYREAHDKADNEAHSRLEGDSKEVLREVREFRKESTRQHEALSEKTEAYSREDRASRGELHTKINDVTKVTERLLAYHEAHTKPGG